MEFQCVLERCVVDDRLDEFRVDGVSRCGFPPARLTATFGAMGGSFIIALLNLAIIGQSARGEEKDSYILDLLI